MPKPRTWDDIPAETVNPGHSRQAFRGDNVMVVRNVADPGVGVEMHSHPNEQLVYIVRGQLEMHCLGEVHILGPGSLYHIPGGVAHGGAPVGDESCEIIDIFSPVREDFSHLVEYQDEH